MKFLIFGSQDLIIKDNVKNALYESTNYNNAVSTYEDICKSYKYDNVYLIFDFGIDNSKFSKSSIARILKREVPYIIIGEFHLGFFDSIWRDDNLILESKGFSHSFKNNKAAIEKFVYFIENKIICSLQFKYTDNQKDIIDKFDEYSEFRNDDKFELINSIDIIRGNSNIKKIIIDPYLYCNDFYMLKLLKQVV